MRTLFLLLLSFCAFITFAHDNKQEIRISDDIELIKISDNAYVHITYYELPQFGRFPSNGLLLIEKGEAFLFDTPMSEELTKKLVEFIKDSLNIKIVGIVPNHWHDDCTAGMAYLHSLGAESYANQMTIDIMKEKNLPLPKHGFKDSLELDLNGKKIVLNYFGAGHATDNIVAYIPSEKILFAGCMAKEAGSKSIGNLSDAVLDEWPKTIQKVIDKYGEAKIIIPGHGNFGGIEVLEHTLVLLKDHLAKNK